MEEEDKIGTKKVNLYSLSLHTSIIQVSQYVKYDWSWTGFKIALITGIEPAFYF
jgi:hypothetical protein